MQLLLINKNPAVSRLIPLSVDKMGLSIKEISDFESYEGIGCDIALIDSDLYDESAVTMFKNMGLCSHLVYIGARGSEKPSLMDSMLEKPFLPTDFIEMMEAITKNLTTPLTQKAPDMSDSFEEEESFSETLASLDDENIEQTPKKEEEEESIDLDDEDSLNDMFDDLDSLEDADEEADDAFDEDTEEVLSMDDIMNELGTLEEEEQEETVEKEALTLEEEPSEAEESADERGILDSDEIREVKELLEEGPEEAMPDEKEEAAKDDLDIDSFGDDFALEEDEEDGEQSVEELMKAIDSMDATQEETSAEENISEEDFEFPSLDNEEAISSVEDTLDEILEEDPLAILETLDDEASEAEIALEKTTEDEIKEEVKEDVDEKDGADLNPLAFLSELENEAEASDEDVEEELDEALGIPASDLLLEVEENDEEAFDAPEIEAIEASKDAKAIPGGDFFDLLDEASLKAALGESIEEEPEETTQISKEDENEEDASGKDEMLTQLKDDIHSSISQSLGSVLEKEHIKEALKGMKININITFEEE